MYIGKGSTTNGFIVDANVNDFNFTLDKDKELGTTPVGFFTIAILGCVAMSARGYFIKFHKKNDVDIDVEAKVNTDSFNVEEWKIEIDMVVDFDLKENEEQEVYNYVKKVCTVSKLITDKVEFILNIKKR